MNTDDILYSPVHDDPPENHVTEIIEHAVLLTQKFHNRLCVNDALRIVVHDDDTGRETIYNFNLSNITRIIP